MRGEIPCEGRRAVTAPGCQEATIRGLPREALAPGRPTPSPRMPELMPTVLAIVCSIAAICLAALAARLWRRLRKTRHERIRLEAELDDQRDLLRRTRKRARELAVWAQSAKALRNEFVANISHEVRTPMNTITGMTELALSTELSDKQRHYMERVRDSADRLLGLLNDLLDLAKIHKRELRLQPVPFRPVECLQNVIARFRVLATQKDVLLRDMIDPAIPDELVGDPGRFRQTVAVLLSNAFKFTDRGEVECRVEIAASRGRHVELHVAVRDTGIGITPEQKRVIFNEFRQADASETRDYEGLGLGLPIATRLVQLMNGRLWFESEPGHGSTFHFTAVFEQPAESLVAEHAFDLSRLRGLRAVIVEPEFDHRSALKRWLEDQGLRVEAVATPTEAQSRMEAERADFAVLGAIVSSEDAFAAAEKLADLCHRRNTGMLLVASAGQRGDADRCLAIGISAYLTEPVSPFMLGLALFEMLEQSPSRREHALITSHSLRESGLLAAAVQGEQGPADHRDSQ